MFRKDTNITALNFTLAPLWVLGEGVLCCISTALRGLGHQRRREMVRSDKFAEPFELIRQCHEIMGYVGFAKSWRRVRQGIRY